MRIWSISPKYLDNKRLVALWRESLLARAVLEGKTKGYKSHPQLFRFKNHPYPVSLINKYLSLVHQESVYRGFSFDKSKIGFFDNSLIIPVSDKQLFYEINHLFKKLDKPVIKNFFVPQANSLFSVFSGEIEPWEKIK